jgi:hypothetical protein
MQSLPIGQPVKDGTHREERLEVASVALNPYKEELEQEAMPHSSSKMRSGTKKAQRIVSAKKGLGTEKNMRNQKIGSKKNPVEVSFLSV